MSDDGLAGGRNGESAAVARLSEQVDSLRREMMRELDAVRREVSDLQRELEGPPRGESLRGRLHSLESDAASAKYASSALRQAQEDRRYRLGVAEWAAGPLIGICATIGAAAILHALGLA